MTAEFGIEIPVAYCPDSFGHAASLPKILASSGFKYYIFQRPSSGEKPDLPADLFYWEHEGSRILCYRLKYLYTQGRTPDTQPIDQAIADDDFVKGGISCFFFGVGDHGGGPTKQEIEHYLRKQAETSTRELRFSTCLEYFQAAEKIPDIPVYSGDLHMHAVGCYSVNRRLKHTIRSAERALCFADRVRGAAGMRDCESLDPLWEKVIFNEFHDIMPGSCAPDAAKQATDEVGGALTTCRDLSYDALKKLSSAIPAKCEQGEFRIFNSLDKPVTGPFEIESFMYYIPGAVLKDSTGRPLQVQEITPSVYCANRRGVFVDTIPAKTTRAYYFDSEDINPDMHSSGYAFEPGKEVVQGDVLLQAPGQIFRNGKPIFSVPLKLGVIRDSSDTWGHGVRGFGDISGVFEETFSSVHSGPIASFLHSRQKFGDSEARLTFTAYRDLPIVDIDIRIAWREKQSILKLLLEPAVEFGSIIAQGPGAAIEKKTDGAEEPMHGWISAGRLGIMQDGAFAFDRNGKQIRITLVRSSLFGYDICCPFDAAGPLNLTDQGEHSFKFRFIDKDGLSTSDMDQAFSGFIEPFHVLREGKDAAKL